MSHTDDVTDTSAGKLSDILISHSLLQHVKSSTHTGGHTLDLFITRHHQPVAMLPLLSDQALVVADCVSPPPPDEAVASRTVRDWRSLDIDAFAADPHQTSQLVVTSQLEVTSQPVVTSQLVMASQLVVSPPQDVSTVRRCDRCWTNTAHWS